MTHQPNFATPRMARIPSADNTRIAADAPRAYSLDEYLDHLCQIEDERFVDEHASSTILISPMDLDLPINSLTEDDLRFLRDFILSSAMYVEQLEAFLCDSSDDFWEAREQAYRIITALLIRHYEYELEG